jgi:peptide deformylase
MIIKKVTQVGNKIIRTRVRAVKDIKSKQTQKTVQDLIDSMRHHELVGMAAPQISRDARIFVSEIRKTKFRKNINPEVGGLKVFINPKIIESSKKQVLDWEGCGSVAHSDLFGLVPRAKSVTVTAYDEKGKKFTLKAVDLLARIIQHENDHLNGVLFIDKADPKSFMSGDEYMKMRKAC